MITALEKAWAENKLPIIQGIVLDTGLYYAIEKAPDRFHVAEPVPFSFDFTSSDFSDIDRCFTVKIEDCTLYCGEGSWGSDGFIYIENTNTKKLRWCFFGDFNPIIKCTLADNIFVAENNNGCQYIFDFHHPEKVRCTGRE